MPRGITARRAVLPIAGTWGASARRGTWPPGSDTSSCRGLHAEQNAIIQAAYHGVSIKGGVLYSTHLPCSICVKMIINAGIGHVLHLEGYPDDLAATLISESGIIITRVAKA